MKSFTRLSLFVLLLMPLFCNAQTWYRYYGKGIAKESYELPNGNILIWAETANLSQIPESYFLLLAPNGDFIEKIEFLDEGFISLHQNPDGSFVALGVKVLGPGNVSPTWFHLSPSFDIIESVNLGLDNVIITGNPYPTDRMVNGLFHANGDFTVILNVNGPGVASTKARCNSDKDQLWLNNNVFNESLRIILKEDYAGNYLFVTNGAVGLVGTLDANWNPVWDETLSSPVENNATPLPNGNTLVTTISAAFNNNMLLDGSGALINSPTTPYPTYDYGGLVNTSGEIVLAGKMVNTDLFQTGTHLRKADINGNGLVNNWLSFEDVRFREIIQLMDGGYLLLGNEMVALPGQSLQADDIVVARTSPSGQLYEGQIQGVVTVESDMDCAVVSNDPEFPNFKIVAQGTNNVGAVSATNGTFILPANFDTYTVSLVAPSPFWEVCENDLPVTLNDTEPVAQLPFLVHANGNCAYPALSIGAQWLRRCFSNNYHYSIRNFGSEPLVGAELVLSLDDFMAFEEATWAVASQNGNEVRLAVPDVPPFGWATGYAKILLTCDAQLGQEHCLGASLQQLPACLDDYLPFEAEECRPNTGSYDPNDLTAFADGQLVDHFIFDEKSLEYLVRFQNTGTDTAFRVVVETLLPNELELSTLEFGASSHAYTTKLEGRLLRFIFDDILLPDSTTDNDGSNGFVKFRMSMKEGLQIGDSIRTEANIFFDFNAPITTNDVTLVLSEFLGSNELAQPAKLHISPNPMVGAVTEVSLEAWQGAKPVSLLLFDTMGRQKLHLEQNGASFTLRKDELKPGIYFIQLLADGQLLGNGKLVVGAD